MNLAALKSVCDTVIDALNPHLTDLRRECSELAAIVAKSRVDLTAAQAECVENANRCVHLRVELQRQSDATERLQRETAELMAGALARITELETRTDELTAAISSLTRDTRKAHRARIATN